MCNLINLELDGNKEGNIGLSSDSKRKLPREPLQVLEAPKIPRNTQAPI